MSQHRLDVVIMNHRICILFDFNLLSATLKSISESSCSHQAEEEIQEACQQARQGVESCA
jgi:hypothetical protein